MISGCSMLPRKKKNPDSVYSILTYYTDEKISFDRNTFDSFTSITILTLNLQPNVMSAQEKKLNFITYHTGFLNKINKFFPQAAISKYKIISTTRSGKILTRTPSASRPAGFHTDDFEVEFNHVNSSESESNSIRQLLASSGLNKKVSGKISEKALYKQISDLELWQSVSSELTSGDDMLLWKNRQGSLSFLKPYTEFSPDIERTYHSTDYDYNSYQYKKL